MAELKRCPRCGHPGGLIRCPSCHGTPRAETPPSLSPPGPAPRFGYVSLQAQCEELCTALHDLCLDLEEEMTAGLVPSDKLAASYTAARAILRKQGTDS